MKTPTRHSLPALIAATAVLGLPAANAWAAVTAAPSATTPQAKAAAAAKAASVRKAAAAAKAASVRKAAAKPVRRTIVGPTSDMRWGPVTVTIVVAGNKIVDVSADLPIEKARSQYINSRVGPYLRQELLQTQSGQVNVITGATMTCESYAASLQGALDKAGIKKAAASFSARSASSGTSA